MISAVDSRLVQSNTAFQRLELVSSGDTSRKFFSSALRFRTSRRNVPITRVDSSETSPGAGTATA